VHLRRRGACDVENVTHRVHPAPFALASDGSVLVNLAMLGGSDRFAKLPHVEGQHEVEVFIGVRLAAGEQVQVLKSLENAADEAVARLFGQRRRRETARRRRKATS